MIYPCGCHNEVDANTGILKSISKCTVHKAHARPDVENLGLDYYNFKEGSWSYLQDGIPHNDGYRAVMTKVLGDLGVQLYRSLNTHVLEIGAGLGQYVSWFLSLGYHYTAVEPSRFAARWLKEVFSVPVLNQRFEQVTLPDSCYHLVLMAHCLEHVTDALATVKKIYRIMAPGGTLLIVVPDDKDGMNPDHQWFFTEASLRRLLERVGFTDVRMLALDMAGRGEEKFIHCRAVKPDVPAQK